MAGWEKVWVGRRAWSRKAVALAALVVAGVALGVAALGSASLTPGTATFTVTAGTGTTETNKVLQLPAVPPKADVEIAIDTTGSMQGGINDAIAEANALVSGIQAQVPDTDFAVVQFKDHPDNPEYQVVQSMTPSSAAVQNALLTLFAVGGGDPPESYNLVFHNSYTDPGHAIGWRDGTRRFVVVIGDAQPHGPVASDGFPACIDESPDQNGLDTKTELAGMLNAGLTLLMIHETDPGSTTTLACYKQLAAATYPTGDAVDSGGSGLAQQIIGMIDQAFSTVHKVELQVDAASPSPADPSWITLPPPFTDIAAPGSYPFPPIGINVPAGTPPGTYQFDLVAIADGKEDIGHEQITVVVPAPNGLVLCKAADNGTTGTTFDYTVTSVKTGTVTKLSVAGGQCSDPQSLDAGKYTIREDLSSNKWSVKNIAVDPAGALVSAVGNPNLTTGTVKVNLSATAQTKVTYTNAPITSSLQVCKWSATPSLRGSVYHFGVAGNTLPQPLQLTATAGPSKRRAGCSAVQSVPTGAQLTVTEQVPSGQVAYASGTGVTDKGAGVATLKTVAGANVVYYEDEPDTGYFSICKRANQTGTFTFKYPDLSGAIQTTQITVTDPTVDACFGPVLVHSGNVTVTEVLPNQDFVLAGIFATPTSALVGTPDLTHGQATIAVPPARSASGGVSVTFVNNYLPAGTASVEICKDVVPTTFNGTIFRFNVPGYGTIQQAAGRCHAPLDQVPLKNDLTFTMSELFQQGWLLKDVTATDQQGTPLPVTRNGLSATIDTTGAVGIVEVHFLNVPQTVQLKVCKLIDPGSVTVIGNRDYSFTVTVAGQPGATTTATVHPPYPGPQSCTTLLLNIPVFADTLGNPIKVTVQETSPGGTAVSAVTVDNIWSGTPTGTILGPNGSITFNPGGGVTVVTFTNKASS